MSTKHDDIVQLLERIKTPGKEPDAADFLSHMDFKPVSLRVYEVKGRDTSITVPETYARQLDEVRTLRRDVKLLRPKLLKLSHAQA